MELDMDDVKWNWVQTHGVPDFRWRWPPSDIVAPKNARQSRVRNYIHSLDVFWRIDSWPAWAQEAIMAERKDYRQRYNLFYFLVYNGLSAEMAYDWIVLYDVVNGQHIPVKYDVATLNDLRGLVGKANAGRLFTSKPVMNMQSGFVDYGVGRPAVEVNGRNVGLIFNPARSLKIVRGNV